MGLISFQGTVEFTSDLAARTFRYKFPEDSNFHGDEINLIEAISSNVRVSNFYDFQSCTAT